jgi:hypothetical protein
MLSPGFTCSELGGQDGDPSNWREAVGGRQLEWSGTQHVGQHGAEEILSVVVPQHGSRGRLMRSCMLMDPLGAQVVH